jgi:hypothetical protein
MIATAGHSMQEPLLRVLNNMARMLELGPVNCTSMFSCTSSAENIATLALDANIPLAFFLFLKQNRYSTQEPSPFAADFQGCRIDVYNLAEKKAYNKYLDILKHSRRQQFQKIQTETQREAPISPYATGKVAATHLLEMLYLTEGFPSTTLRLFLTYGPGQDSRRFLPQIIKGCIENRTFPTSAGQQLRDFCFIQDVVEAVFDSFSKAAAHGETINVGSGTGVTIRQMIETVKRQIGKGTPLFGEVAYRPGENMVLYADVSKAKRILGWAPKVTLEEGLDQTIQWFKERT